jgi:hypothetical protein
VNLNSIREKARRPCSLRAFVCQLELAEWFEHYIPTPPAALAFGASAIMHFVVSIRDATEAAFCSAVRISFFGVHTSGTGSDLV